VFPLRARNGGVLTRRGHTEGSVDLARMAGLRPAAVLCELMNPDGTMMRRPEALAYAERQGLPDLTIEELVTYRSLR
jgi:3,4-dihydroxy 2-butanone 4-phosphate synthase